jgi:peptide methionine sulfoxide reductase MsrA
MRMLDRQADVDSAPFDSSSLADNIATLGKLMLAMNAPVAAQQTLGRQPETHRLSPNHAPIMKGQNLDRRAMLAGAAALPLAQAVQAEAEEEEIDVYFGCGCFWHVQHEFVEAERKILGRSDTQLTARAGYAGGNAGADNGKVCYHNAQRVADYGSLGHAEVVRLRIPPSKFGAFAEEYFKLFDAKGMRPDQFGDRGLEYRNLVGFPGGSKSPLANTLVEASKKQGDKLDFAVGKGDDPDKPQISFVMDSEKYPFYLGEAYHQFHDGFAFGEDYPREYNGITGKLIKQKALADAGCPNGMFGVGIAGL